MEPDDAAVAPGPEEDDIAAGYVPISYPSDDAGEGGSAAAAAAASAASPTAGESADAESLRSSISELEDKRRELPTPSSPGAVSRDEVEEAAAFFRVTFCRFPRMCAEAGVPELAPVFCAVDAHFFGGVERSIALDRPETLAAGGGSCPFSLRWVGDPRA